MEVGAKRARSQRGLDGTCASAVAENRRAFFGRNQPTAFDAARLGASHRQEVSPRSPGVEPELRNFRERSFSRGAAGSAESFLKLTGHPGFALPRWQSFRWNFGFKVESPVCSPIRLSCRRFAPCSPAHAQIEPSMQDGELPRVAWQRERFSSEPLARSLRSRLHQRARPG